MTDSATPASARWEDWEIKTILEDARSLLLANIPDPRSHDTQYRTRLNEALTDPNLAMSPTLEKVNTVFYMSEIIRRKYTSSQTTRAYSSVVDDELRVDWTRKRLIHNPGYYPLVKLCETAVGKNLEPHVETYKQWVKGARSAAFFTSDGNCDDGLTEEAQRRARAGTFY
jgi:hypothetical protein